MAKPAKSPWMKWYPSDWRQEPTLRLCSRAARSLWLDMLGLMHEAEPYGYLLVSGRQIDAKQLAAVLGDSERDVKRWLIELEEAGVFSRADDGTIISRRMLRDRVREDANRNNGHSGGNPTLRRGSVPKAERVRPYKRTDSPQKTLRIFNKSQGRCHWCSVELVWDGPLAPNLFHVDHVLPICDGGTNDEENLVAACAACNHKRARLDSVGSGEGVGVGTPPDSKAQKPEARSHIPEAKSDSLNVAAQAKAEDDGLELPEFMRRAPPVQTRIVAGGFKQIGAGKRIKNPQRADADMEAYLAGHCGLSEQDARRMVLAARDPSSAGHHDARRFCTQVSRDNKLGWFHEEAMA